MKWSWKIIVLIVLTGIWIAGCQPEKKFQAYEDQQKKGEQVFLKDVEACQDFANQNIKRREGSEGAGERLNRKHSLFRLCMESNHWTLKQ